MSLSDRLFHNMRNLLITLTLFLFFGCSQMEKDLGVPNPELDTTDRGIAAGAAIGAGLGALVGSTAGEAGVGLVVGSVAGATTGGVIGKSFQDQEELSRTQDEKIQAQEERLSEQERQLEELRNRNLSDTSSTRSGKKKSQQARVKELPLASSNSASTSSRELVSEKNAPSRVAKRSPAALNSADGTLGRAEAREVARGKLREGTIEQAKTSTTSKTELRTVDNSIQTGKGRVREEVVAELPPVVSLPEPVRPALDGAPASQKTVEASPPSSGLPPAVTAIPQKVPASIAKVDAPDEKIALDEKKELKTSKKDSKATQTAKKAPSTTEQKVSCPEARQEAERARNAASESDKVFYLRRAMRLCPQDSSLHVELGKVYSGLGLKDDARGEFHKALEVDPANETAQDELSVMMLEGNS